MPSGSHGGHTHTGGSFSGGAVSGGSHSSGNGHRGMGGFFIGPWHFHIWGNHYVVPTRARGLMSLFNAVLVVAIFVIFAGVMMSASAKTDIGKAERDFQRYQAMIINAHVNPDLLVTGKIENHYYDDDAEKWYIEYSFPTQDGGKIKGESYCVYTLTELQQAEYQVGAAIQIAVDRVPAQRTDDVDSIPMDYENMPLERDGAYVAAQNTYRIGRIMWIVAAIAVGGVIVLNIAIFCVTKKKADAAGNALDGTTVTPATTAADTAAAAPKYCPYCGVRLGADDTKCPGCGAKVK